MLDREATSDRKSASEGSLRATWGAKSLLVQGETGRPRARRMLTDTDPAAQRLYDLFGLDAYAPKR